MAISQRDRRRIERELISNEAWRVRAGRHWLCPYCAEPVTDRQGRYPVGDGRELQAVVQHLEGCAAWGGFQGRPLPLGELKARARRLRMLERVRRALLERPSWQLYDVERHWYCPYCAEATEVRVPAGGKISARTLGAICRHLRRCTAHARGRGAEKPLAYLESMVAYANRIQKMAEAVRRRIESDAVWRLRDAEGRWVCPYCRRVCEHIEFATSEQMVEVAPREIARHLIAGCAAFRRALMRRGAGGEDGASRSPALSGEIAHLGAAPTPDLVKLSGRPPASVSGEWARAGGEGGGGDSGRLPGASDSGPLPVAGGAEAPAGGVAPAGGATASADSARPRPPGAGAPLSEGAGQPESGGEPERWRSSIDARLAEVRSSVIAMRGAPGAAAEPPPLPEVEGLELRAFQRTAGHLAGDFIDVVTLEGERLVCVVGAAAGEGGEAALLVPVARNLLRMHLRRDRPLTEVLRQVNADLCAEGEARSFIALVLAVLERNTLALRFARAGLHPPLLYSERRQPALAALECPGMALGLDRGEVFERALGERCLQLAPGDLLVFHTVGAFQALDVEGRAFGYERLLDAVRRYGRHEADYFITKFARLFEDWTRGAPLREDASVLAIKVRG
ncbi:MAG: hypothetical protein KatS3mg102_1651 [Planctomycetota bacterium]|nr:MAG: hypothetical protein KatS3mg102_1651 [Planctomycetota bacterium]